MPAAEVRQSVPLTSTAEFIALQYRLVHTSILDYLAGSAALEVDPGIYRERGDPYQHWEAVYGLNPDILAPVREHIRDDVEAGHASLFRAVASELAPAALPVQAATSAFLSARTVFEATRLWQRDIYEHYQLRQGSLRTRSCRWKAAGSLPRVQPSGTGFPPARLAQLRQAYPVFRIEDAQATAPGDGVLRMECRFTCGAHVFRRPGRRENRRRLVRRRQPGGSLPVHGRSQQHP